MSFTSPAMGTYPYSYQSAGDRYQALLAQQAADKAADAATPTGKVAVYNLRERRPDWALVLEANPSAYGVRSLRTAIAVLEDVDATLPHATKTERATAALQLRRFKDALALKS